jgi:ribonuclease HI
VTHYLHRNETNPPAVTDSGDMKTADRQLHAAIQQALKPMWPANPTQQSRNILHILLNVAERREPAVLAARDEMADRIRDVLRQNRRCKGADLRQAQPAEYKLLKRKKHKATTGQAQYKVLKQRCSHLTKNAYYAKLLELYTKYSHSAELITEVNGLSHETPRIGKGKTRRKAGPTQQLAAVTWAPTHQPGWLMELAQELGYKVKETAIETRPTACLAGVHKPCEYCTLPETQDNGMARVECEVCLRHYHRACLIDNGEQDPAEAYTCTECASGLSSRHGQGQPTTPDTLDTALQMHATTWEEALEPFDKVRCSGTPEAQRQLATLLQQQTERGTKPGPTAATASKATHAKTKAFPDGRVYDITVGQKCRRQLVIHPAPIHPHADISATGRTEVVVRPVLVQEQGSEPAEVERACVYLPDGRCSHLLDPRVAAAARERFLHTRQHQPELFDKLRAGTFEEELHRLLVRYCPGNELAGKQVTRRDQCALPSALGQLLHATVSSTTEHLASPLNVSPAAAAYWSLHERDQLFGASLDAYNVRWTGPSLAVPDLDSAAADQAVHWALKSAIAAEEPTLTLLVLPSFGQGGSAAACMRRVRANPSHCKHLLTLPSSSVGWNPGGLPLQKQEARCKYNLLVVAVGNQEGYAAHLPYWQPGWADRLHKGVKAALLDGRQGSKLPAGSYLADHGATWWNAPPQDVAVEQGFDEHAESGRTSRNFRNKPRDHDRKARSAALTDLTGSSSVTEAVQLALHHLKAVHPTTPPLRYKWQEFVYTDGSALLAKGPHGGPRIGAAAYVPACARLGRTERVLEVPCEVPEVGIAINTINRAELAGINAALEAMVAGLAELQTLPAALHIATDSLASMYQIRRWNTRPQDMREHRHLTLIEQIGRRIASSPVPIHIWKVKSHIGIVGNEIADAAAVRVANRAGEADSDDEDDLSETSSDMSDSDAPPSAAGLMPDCMTVEWPCYTASNDRHRLYWPHTRATAREADAATSRKKIEIVRQPVPNLAETLKQHMHHARQLGSSNQEALYYSGWHRMDKDIDHKYSHMFMSSSKVRFADRKRVLQYRYGLLPTQKLMKRYHLADSSLCPLCGEEDGGHHAVSACRQLSTTVTLRHNDAGTAIVEAIAQGEKGGQLIASDVGWRRRRQQALPEAATTRHIAATALPESIPLRLRRQLVKQSIPDALLYSRNEETGDRRYTIVEIKYCRDTRPEDQQARAAAQHAALKTTIEEHDPASCVTLVPLMLGVGGVIYKSTSTALKEHLGVAGPRLRQLLTTLHYTAVTGLNRVWRQRQAAAGKKELKTRSKTRRTSRHKHGVGRPGNRRYRIPKKGTG